MIYKCGSCCNIKIDYDLSDSFVIFTGLGGFLVHPLCVLSLLKVPHVFLEEYC